MNFLLNIDIYAVSGIFLGIVLFNAYRKLDRRIATNRLFLLISLGILIGLISEFISVFINGRPEKWMLPVTELLHVILFTVCPIVAFLWYEFTNKWIDSDDGKGTNLKKIFILPLIINTIMTVLSPFTNQIFRFSESNIYYRGPMFYVPTICTYFYLFFSLVNVIKKRNRILNDEAFPLILFSIIPAVGGALQLVFYGLRLLWSTSAFSIIIVFIYVQQRMMQIDTLTGAWTRGSFEHFLEKRYLKDNRENRFGIIYIDMDDFKQINDSYGHQEGDIALKSVVALIKEVIAANDIITRVGGDEFIVLTENASISSIDVLVEKIKEKLNEYNKSSNKGYSLNCSFGYDVYDPKNYTISQFINYVDHLMYMNKDNKQAQE